MPKYQSITFLIKVSEIMCAESRAKAASGFSEALRFWRRVAISLTLKQHVYLIRNEPQTHQNIFNPRFKPKPTANDASWKPIWIIKAIKNYRKYQRRINELINCSNWDKRWSGVLPGDARCLDHLAFGKFCRKLNWSVVNIQKIRGFHS